MHMRMPERREMKQKQQKQQTKTSWFTSFAGLPGGADAGLEAREGLGADGAGAHLAEDLDEVGVALAEDLAQHEALRHDGAPAVGLEAEAVLVLVGVKDGRQLEEVAAQDHLDAAKRLLALPHRARHVLDLVKQLAADHRHLVHNQHLAHPPPLQPLPRPRHVSQHLLLCPSP